MSHLLAIALCVAGFAALALAMRRQQRDIIGRPLPQTAISLLRVAGAGALLCALGILAAWHGWSAGLVMLSGHTSIAAGLVLCALIAHARTNARKMRHR